jgi:hypothetical protein
MRNYEVKLLEREIESVKLFDTCLEVLGPKPAGGILEADGCQVIDM